MKILAIIGSIRKGNTKYLVEKSLSHLETNKDIIVDIINLTYKKISFCNGCLSCDETGECVIEDDMSDIIKLVREADALILATPTRWGLLSGEMKTLLDRLNPLAVREELRGKKSVIISVGQSEKKDNASIILAANSLKVFCENAGIKVVDLAIISDCYGPNDVKDKHKDIQSCILTINKLINN